jgi:hypothetical protein
VAFICHGLRLHGRCIEISGGGMFHDCQSTAAKG